MKYSANLVKEILAELEKVPLIRQAAAKVGIDHSTLYRWMLKHPEFRVQVEKAKFLGRRRITDAAESVIIGGIHNKDMGAAKFWLTHNEQRYMGLYTGRHHSELAEGLLEAIKSHTKTTMPTFEKAFDLCDKIEEIEDDPKEVERLMSLVVEVLCHDDPKLESIFYAAYENWKQNRDSMAKLMADIGVEDEDMMPPERYPTYNPHALDK